MHYFAIVVSIITIHCLQRTDLIIVMYKEEHDQMVCWSPNFCGLVWFSGDLLFFSSYCPLHARNRNGSSSSDVCRLLPKISSHLAAIAAIPLPPASLRITISANYLNVPQAR
jgi:hypothetical protein